MVRQQIPNIPWPYYDVICEPIFDHALVLLGVQWLTAGRVTKPPPLQPSVARWYTPHFQKFTTQMASVRYCDTRAPLARAHVIMSAIARAPCPRRKRNNQTTTHTWADISSHEKKLRDPGAAQEQQIRR